MINRREPQNALGNSEFQTGASPSAVTNFTISNILRLQNSPSQQAISIKLTDDCFETLQRAARENHEVLVHIDKKGITIEIKTSSSFIKFDCFVQRVSGSVFRVLQRSQNTYNDIANIAMRAQVKPTEKTFQSSRSKAEALSKHLEKESSKCRTQMLQAPVKANDKKYNFTNISKVMGKSSIPSPRNGSSLSSVASSSPVQSNTKISSPMNALSNNSKSSSLKERVIHYIICGKFNNPDDIVDHIISEGLPSNIIADSARRKIREIICEVAEEYRNPPKLVLLPKYHQQVDLNWPFFTSEERSKAQNSLAETTLEAGNNFAPLRASTRGPLVAPKSKTKKVSTPPAMTNSTTTSPEIASDGSISMTPSPAEQSQIIINDHRPVSSMPKRKKDDIKSDKMDMSDDVPPTKKHRSDVKEHSGSNKERPKKDNLSNEINRILDKSEMKKNGDSTRKERKEAEKIVHSSNDKHGFESGSSSKLPFEERKKSKKNGDETSETSKSKEKEKRNKSSNAEKQSKSTSKSKHDSEFSTNLPTSSSSKSQNFIESGSKSKEKNSSRSKKDSSSAQNSDESSSKPNSETRKKDYVKNESEKKEKSQKSRKEWDTDEKLKDKKEKRSKEEKKVVDDLNVQKTDRKNKDGEKSKKVEEILSNDAVKKIMESKKSEKSSEAKADKKQTMPTTTSVPKTKSEKAEKDKKSESKTKNKNDQTKCNEKSSKESTKEKHEKIKESNKKIVADLKTMSIRDLLNLLSEPVKPSKNYEEKYPPIRNVADAKTYQDHEIKYYEDYQKAYKYLRTIEKDLGTLVERLNNSTTDSERENIEDKIRNYATHCTQDSSYKNQRQIVANMTSAIEVLRNRLSVFYGQNQQLQ